MVQSTQDSLDPRIRRTRQLLHEALEGLLQEKDFDKISIQDIADAATVNRVTFYDHYPDKFALLECVVGSRFFALLAERGVRIDGSCSSALRGIVLAVCDYLAQVPGIDSEGGRLMEPHLEAAVIAVVRRMFLEGLVRHGSTSSVPVGMIATAISWAIYGAAQEWVRTPNRCSSERIVETVVALVSPILGSLQPG